jgi:SAM-dependent methyltransferase
MDPVYFYQDTWAARKLFELKPVHHYDVGSSAKTIGILSQFAPITMIDIRPLPLKLPNLHFIKGSIIDLPLNDNSVDSISSLCVVEHIGLGRYGDDIDAFGSEKSILELKRVVKIGGILLFSVPVDSVNTIYFNAHRAFTREYVMSMFFGYELLEERYQYGDTLIEKFIPEFGFGTGLYMFKKIRHASSNK